MASILDSKSKYYQYDLQRNGEDYLVASLQSDGDLLIKELLKKQLNTNASIEKVLKEKKVFVSNHCYRSETESTSGVASHKEFAALCSNLNETTSPTLSNSPETSCAHKSIGRHLKELALAVKPNSLETKLLKFAVSCNAVGNVDQDLRTQDHPINQLSAIERNRFSFLRNECKRETTTKTILRKRKQLLEATSVPVEIKQRPTLFNGKTLWDVTESQPLNKKLNRTNGTSLCPYAKPKLFTIKDGIITELRQNELDVEVQEQPIDNISSNQSPARLLSDDIRAIPKFQNYDKGLPSKTLYLKNLAPSVREEELADIFEKYLTPKGGNVTFKLMKKGRMHGQAFVYFQDSDEAAKAMEKINGLIVHKKAIIAQFSSRKCE